MNRNFSWRMYLSWTNIQSPYKTNIRRAGRFTTLFACYVDIDDACWRLNVLVVLDIGPPMYKPILYSDKIINITREVPNILNHFYKSH